MKKVLKILLVGLFAVVVGCSPEEPPPAAVTAAPTPAATPAAEAATLDPEPTQSPAPAAEPVIQEPEIDPDLEQELLELEQELLELEPLLPTEDACDDFWRTNTFLKARTFLENFYPFWVQVNPDVEIEDQMAQFENAVGGLNLLAEEKGGPCERPEGDEMAAEILRVFGEFGWLDDDGNPAFKPLPTTDGN